MTIELGSMSRKELDKLREDVDRALQAAEARDRNEALKAAERAVAEFGFTLSEVSTGTKAKSPTKGTRAKAKYRNPNDPTQTWSGRGRKPGWIHDALARGSDITDLEI